MNISLFLAFSKTKLITFGSSVFILVYIYTKEENLVLLEQKFCKDNLVL